MPLVPSTMKSFMQIKAASKLLSGDKLSALVAAVAGATSQYILSASTVNSTNIALGPGGGTQTGRISALSPTVMASLMQVKAAAAGLSGRDIKKLFDAISFGVVQSTKTIVLQGTIIGAGPGTGTGKILGLVPTALKGLILSQSFFRQVSGDKLTSLMDSVAFGITNHIMSAGVVNITDIGVAAGPPIGPVTIPVAPGIGRLV